MDELNKLIQAKFAEMQQTGKLFRSEITGGEVWNLWLQGFEPDPIFRDPESSVHNCNLCNNFIRRYGNIVAIDENYNVVTMFDITADTEYKGSCESISFVLKESKVTEVFIETLNELKSLPYEACTKHNEVFQLGIAENVKRYTKEEAEKFGRVKENEIVKFHHLNLKLNKLFVDMTNSSAEQIMAGFRDAKNVFQRAMETISLDTLKLVRDLISQGSLLDGTTHLHKIDHIIPLKRQYDDLAQNQKDNWCWINSYKMPYAKFRNELIGVLCSELSEGKELNDACQSWNKRVDPANYMRAVAPITKRQIEEAKKFVEENGYVESFDRRHATIDDIKVSEILHSNVGNGAVKSVSIFDEVKATSTRHKRSEFDKIETVSIDKFMTEILPGCTSIEAFFTSQQKGNLVSLTTSNEESKQIFKWNNPYSWTFNGNLAGKSQIKEAVKSRGGNVNGDLRISLSFPDTTNDYDLHVLEPSGTHIYYSNVRVQHQSSGVLDLDAQGVDGHQQPEKRVENVVYTEKSRMQKGMYKVIVNNYSRNGLKIPFFLEVEFEGEIMLLKLNHKLQSDQVEALTVFFDGQNFDVKPAPEMEIVESGLLTQTIYGLETNKFHKVNLVCLSPNHWGENNTGNKHYFFMLEGCKTDLPIRSFHAENLLPELAQHRKVLDTLALTRMIEPAEKQLSGLGFNSTIVDEVVLKLQGSHKRVIKVRFN